MFRQDYSGTGSSENRHNQQVRMAQQSIQQTGQILQHFLNHQQFEYRRVQTLFHF